MPPRHPTSPDTDKPTRVREVGWLWAKHAQPSFMPVQPFSFPVQHLSSGLKKKDLLLLAVANGFGKHPLSLVRMALEIGITDESADSRSNPNDLIQHVHDALLRLEAAGAVNIDWLGGQHDTETGITAEVSVHLVHVPPQSHLIFPATLPRLYANLSSQTLVLMALLLNAAYQRTSPWTEIQPESVEELLEWVHTTCGGVHNEWTAAWYDISDLGWVHGLRLTTKSQLGAWFAGNKSWHAEYLRTSTRGKRPLLDLPRIYAAIEAEDLSPTEAVQ